MSKPTAKMVKSAQRVMELLEFFDAGRPEATVMDLVRVLDYPQSSASELLRSLVSLGYLNYDRHRRTYRLTPRVPLLGSWAFASLFRDGALLQKMDEIAEQSDAMVILANIDAFAVRYVHIVHDKKSFDEIGVGRTHSPFRSALGRVIASRWQDRMVLDVVRRLNAEEPNELRRLRASEVVTDLHNVAAVGYAVSPNESGSGCGMVAINIPGGSGLAVGVSCPASTIRDAGHLAELLIDAFARATAPEALRLVPAAKHAAVSPLSRAPASTPRWQAKSFEERRA